MIEQEVPKIITVRIDARLLAQAGGPEKGKRLQRPEGGLTFRYGNGAAGNCKEKGK